MSKKLVILGRQGIGKTLFAAHLRRHGYVGDIIEVNSLDELGKDDGDEEDLAVLELEGFDP